MKNGAIQMVDLFAQYLKIKNEIDTAIQNVVNTSAFIKGHDVTLFQEEMSKFLNVNHVISCANGTDALQIALMALNLQPEDEVITPDFTFLATVEVVALLGLKPVLVDVDPQTFNISIEKIEAAITPKTKVIIPVHLFGQCAEMEAIMNLAKKYNLYVIEDAAQATGAEYRFSDGSTKKAGTIGHIGTTSFFPSKNLGCFGDGGAIFTNNSAIAERIAMIANHGMKKKYYHDEIGINSRLDTIQAAVLRVKLKYLTNFNAARNAAADFYDSHLKNSNIFITPLRAAYSTHIFHQYTLKTQNIDRNALQDFLTQKGIPTMIYYPVPVHLQAAYKKYGFNDFNYPTTNMLSNSVLSLPMHTELTESQLQYIVDSLNEFSTKTEF